MELGCNQPKLVLLSLLKGLIGVEKISARVVHSLIEEQLVEIVAEVIVMGDIFLCPANRVGLLEPPKRMRNATQCFLHWMRYQRDAIDRKECEEVPDSALLELHPPVHVSFTCMQLRVEKQLVAQRPIRKPHRDRRTRSACKNVQATIRIDHLQGADAYERFQ